MDSDSRRTGCQQKRVIRLNTFIRHISTGHHLKNCLFLGFCRMLIRNVEKLFLTCFDFLSESCILRLMIDCSNYSASQGNDFQACFTLIKQFVKSDPVAKLKAFIDYTQCACQGQSGKSTASESQQNISSQVFSVHTQKSCPVIHFSQVVTVPQGRS